MAEALVLPSASQIDPAVLAELPASVRKEIERQVGLVPDDSASTSSVESTPTRRKNATTATLTRFLKQDPKHALFRSASESPTKKRVVNRLLHTAGQYAPKDQHAVDREEVLAMDPSKIATETLKGLGIDAEVFRALPMELQRETFRHHSEQRKSEQARFKAGKTSTFEELTHAEQRRRDTLRAAHSDPTAPPAFLVARPRWRIPRAEARILDSEPQSAVEVPSIRGLTRYEDVEQLIRQWVRAFAVKGPRRGDVDRIATYLAETLRVAAQTRVEEAHKTDAILRLINEAISQEGDKASWLHEMHGEMRCRESTARCRRRLTALFTAHTCSCKARNPMLRVSTSVYMDYCAVMWRRVRFRILMATRTPAHMKGCMAVSANTATWLEICCWYPTTRLTCTMHLAAAAAMEIAIQAVTKAGSFGFLCFSCLVSVKCRGSWWEFWRGGIRRA